MFAQGKTWRGWWRACVREREKVQLLRRAARGGEMRAARRAPGLISY